MTQAAMQQAMAFHQQGHLDAAERAYRAVLVGEPDHCDALHYLGVLRLQAGDAADACDLLTRAAALRPSAVDVLGNLVAAELTLGRFAQSLVATERILALAPSDTQAMFNRALALMNLGRAGDAVAQCDRLISAVPDHLRAVFLRGNALAAQNRFADALADYDRVLSRMPQQIDALVNRGNALFRLGRKMEALAAYDRVLTVDPRNAHALGNRGNILRGLQRFDEAVACFNAVLAFAPDNTDARYNRGNTLIRMGRHADAFADFEAVIAAQPNNTHALNALAVGRLTVCHWEEADRLYARLRDLVRAGARVDPFTLVIFGAPADEQLVCARNFAHWELAQTPKLPPVLVRAPGKIRIAYLSSDFRVHPIAILLARLIELHDRTRFEVVGISYGPDDRSALRKRLMSTFDSFHDVSTKSDAEAAALIRDLHIDIAVDLNNYSDFSRPGILAQRPALIAASYLGYPSTMGNDFIDYVIADDIVLPSQDEAFFTEKVVCLPPSFMVAERDEAIAAAPVPTRSEMGLPDAGFVFCCFNDNYKIRAPVFDIWMRLLGAVDGSVLWLLRSNETAEAVLRAEAEKRGIDPQRLIFAPKLERAAHLARLPLADLFLDTLPVNAGVTAIDALVRGVPVLTMRGDTFVGRVCESLLRALEMPDLVTTDAAAYETAALAFARTPDRLAAIRTAVAENAARTALFDTDLFRRHIEAAYSTMSALWEVGETPQHLIIASMADEQPR